jgi:hypothetical protein
VSRVARGTPAGDAYLDLQNQARRTGRNTNELHVLYVLEGFLARLSVSPDRDSFVLKGGVLLAAFGERRPTSDIDVTAFIANDVPTVIEHVRTVLSTEPQKDDGIDFDLGSVRGEVIREDAEYSGVRVHVIARLATARITFHVDVSVGDPIYPQPETVHVPRILGGDDIVVTGYPMHMTLAEKIVTAVQRGTTSTRWRDFGDIWILPRHHQISGSDLQDAINAVAQYRNVRLRSIRSEIGDFGLIGQTGWSRWRDQQNLPFLPDQFAQVVSFVIDFSEQPLSGDVRGQTWNPETAAWES